MTLKDALTAWSPRALGVLRIVTGMVFLQFGTAKLFHFPAVSYLEDVQLISLEGLAGAIELVGGILLILGLFTRFASFIMSGEMAVAYFMYYPARGFFPIVNGGNLEIMFCFVFFYLIFAGGGPWSLDARREHSRA